MDRFDKVEEFLLAEGYAKEEIPVIMVSLVEQGRPAKRRKPSKSVEQIKAEIDAKNPTKTGSVTGQKVPGVQKSRPATRIPGATGEKPTGSLRSGNLSFPGDRSGAYDAAKQKLSTPKVESPKIKTPPQTGGLLGTRNVPTMKDLGAAPKPAWTGSSGSGQGFPRPPRVPRDAGAFAKQKMLLKTPTPTASTGVFSRLKGLRGATPAQLALNLAAGEALDRYVTRPVAKAGGNALARAILDVTGKGDEARRIQPSLYGKAGPDLTKDIAQGIRSREPRGMSNIPPAEGMVNNPNYGKPADPKTWKNTTKPAPKPAPKPVAAKPEPVGLTGDKAKDRATWRSANTRLARVDDMRKSGASRGDINKVLYRKGTKAYGAK